MLTILGFAGITLFDFAVFNRFWSIISVKKESETQTAESQLSLSNVENEAETGITQLSPINKASKDPEIQTSSQQTDADETKKLEFSRLIGILTDLGYRLTKLAFIRDNSDSLPDNLSLDEFHLILALFSYRGDKLTVIEIFLPRLPDSLSLAELNRILTVFPYRGDKLKVTRIFLPRLKDDYSDSDFERFKNHFSYIGDKKTAIELLLRKNQTQ